MLFDLTDRGERLRLPFSPPTPQANGRNLLTALGFWEEHCIECGAPACYSTCEKYAKTLGGKCRRFVKGIQPVSFSDKTGGYAIQFKEWGKLELAFSGKMISRRTTFAVRHLDAILSSVSRIAARLLSFLPRSISPIALYRAFKRRLLRLTSKEIAENLTWVIQCHAEAPMELRYSIMENPDKEIFAGVLSIKSGWNSFSYDLPRLKRGAYVRLFSIAGTSTPLVFSALDLIQNHEVGRKTDDAAVSIVRPATFVKCVAWDLDNTIWDGILAEDGVGNVRLRESVVSVLKALDSRGILNTICSKNDKEIAIDQLRRFGIADYFVFPAINWNPKSANLSVISKEINIGMDTFAFIDDSENERGEVKEHLPMVRVYTDREVLKLLSMDCFNPPVSAESSKRRQSYLNEMARRAQEDEFIGSRLDFLRDCQILLPCDQLRTETSKARCWELVNRTNQLTLAAHRYDKGAFAQLLEEEGTQAYAIRCRDKYGDYGIIGFLALHVVGEEVIVKEFVMSCRVAKKLCEQSVLLSVAENLKAKGAKRLLAEVVETGRNGALIEAFDAMPFTKNSTNANNPGNSFNYLLDLSVTEIDGDTCFRNKVEWI